MSKVSILKKVNMFKKVKISDLGGVISPFVICQFIVIAQSPRANPVRDTTHWILENFDRF